MTGDPIREVSVRTERSARAWLAGGGGPRSEVWYLLHGYGQLARRFLDRFTTIATPGRTLVAPEALSRFYVRTGRDSPDSARLVGASWMTGEDRLAEIDDYVRYLDRVVEEVEGALPRVGSSAGEARGPGGDSARTVLGFSQGAHTAARWVVMGRTPVTRLILWGGSLPLDLPTEAPSVLADVRVMLVRGADDPLRRPADEARDEAWLASEGVAFEVREHGGAHEIDQTLLEELATG